MAVPNTVSGIPLLPQSRQPLCCQPARSPLDTTITRAILFTRPSNGWQTELFFSLWQTQLCNTHPLIEALHVALTTVVSFDSFILSPTHTHTYRIFPPKSASLSALPPRCVFLCHPHFQVFPATIISAAAINNPEFFVACCCSLQRSTAFLENKKDET